MTATTTPELLTTPRVCARAGVTYRMVDYWCRIGAVHPFREADGSGSQRLFTAQQATAIKLLGQMREMGVPIRAAARASAMIAGAQPGDLFYVDPETGRVFVNPSEVEGVCYVVRIPEES